VGEDPAPLGFTTESGTLEVNLDDALPRDFFDGELPLSMRGQRVLTVDIASLQRVREERLWKRVPVDDCRTPKTSRDCRGLQAFLEALPSGDHQAEARAVLEASAPVVARLLDDEEWRALDTSCKDASFGSSQRGSSDCRPYRAYLDRRPDGVHADEARKILAVADHRIAQLAAAEATAERRAQAEAEAAARAAEANRVLKCQARCRNTCRETTYSDKPMCVRGCNAVGDCGPGDSCSGICRMTCASSTYDDHEGCLRDCRISNGCRQ
jgi:hypothetical protein